MCVYRTCDLIRSCVFCSAPPLPPPLKERGIHSTTSTSGIQLKCNSDILYTTHTILQWHDKTHKQKASAHLHTRTQTHRHTHRHTHMDRQTDRQTDRHTHRAKQRECNSAIHMLNLRVIDDKRGCPDVRVRHLDHRDTGIDRAGPVQATVGPFLQHGQHTCLPYLRHCSWNPRHSSSS